MAALRLSLSRAISAAAGVRAFVCGIAAPSPCFPSSGRTTVRLARTDFFGGSQRLQFVPSPLPRAWSPSRSLSARAKIKRRKDSSFDNVVQREKKVRIVSKIKSILVKQPGRKMTLLQLGKYRRDFGLTGRRRVIALLNRYPGVFEVYEEGCNVMYVRFTEEAEAQYQEELQLKEEMEAFHVEKLRKLLMMSVDKKLVISKIAHLKHDLGLPEDFQASLLQKYPQYFTVVDTEAGPALELTFWDPLLAVSAAERKEAADAAKGDDRPKIIIDGEEIVSTALSNRRLHLPKGLNLSKKDRVVAMKFQQRAYVSPYSDVTGMDPASVDAEKRACATVHELLSLTVEKKTLVDHLTHFKRDYKFSQRIRAMLIRHPEMFYVSFKGHRDSVFLREAYEGSELMEKDPLAVAKLRLSELVHIRRTSTRGESTGGGADDRDEDGDSSDSFDDEIDGSEGDDDDDWGDEEVEVGEDRKRVPATPVMSYAPSPRKPVRTYKDIKARPTDVEVERQTTYVDRPRERW